MSHIFEIHEWQNNRSDPRKVTNVPIFFNGMGHLSPFLQSLVRTLVADESLLSFNAYMTQDAVISESLQHLLMLVT